MRYRVTHYYSSSTTYEVEANSEEEAASIVNGAEPPDPMYEEPPCFMDEMVEQIEDSYVI